MHLTGFLVRGDINKVFLLAERLRVRQIMSLMWFTLYFTMLELSWDQYLLWKANTLKIIYVVLYCFPS